MKYNDHVKLLYPLSNVKLADSAINTVAERAQRAANRKNTCKLRKHFRQFDNAHAVKAHNTLKKRAANKMYVVVLWAFAVCFFICLCCEHLHHLLSKWWKCFLDLLVLFLFACVFWSCSALSSLGHRRSTMLHRCLTLAERIIKHTHSNLPLG